MIRLPISGLNARWRAAHGFDDIVLAELAGGLGAAVAFAARAVVDADGAPLDVASLPVGDLDVLVVERRRELLGDGFVAEGTCRFCGAAVDIHFSLAEYCAHRAPKNSRAAHRSGDSSWLQLRGRAVSFRVPTAADVLVASGSPDGRAELIRRCVRGDVDPRTRRAVLRAMETVGPTMRAEVAGHCPECAAAVILDVDARELCLTELRFLARGVHGDVHLIAATYHWTEDAILALPSTRRTHYAALIRDGRVTGRSIPQAVRID